MIKSTNGAKALNEAVRLFREAAAIQHTRPRIVFTWGVGFLVTHYYSDELLSRLGWWVCYKPATVNKNVTTLSIAHKK